MVLEERKVRPSTLQKSFADYLCRNKVRNLPLFHLLQPSRICSSALGRGPANVGCVLGAESYESGKPRDRRGDA